MHPCPSRSGLACCHGYRVAAGEREVGCVETPIFAGPSSEPAFLRVRTSAAIAGTFRIVPTRFVIGIDADRRRVAIAVEEGEVATLPERLPLGVAARTGDARP